MGNDLHRLTPDEVQSRLSEGRAILVDIREPAEFARSHVAGAVSHPLSTWEAARVEGPAYVLEGGLDGWMKAGLPLVTDKNMPIDVMRQVQIAAGSRVVLGVLLGVLVAPGFYALSAFVGAGLVFAGATGFCGMARRLLMAPWNRRLRAA
jgi:rhodanese-related sulfurtransferase